MHMPGVAVIGRYVAASNGSVGHLSAYINGGTTMELLFGLYDDVGGAPGELLTSATTTSFQFGWVTVATPPISVTQGTTYWIAVLSPVMTGTFWPYITKNESNLPCADMQHSASTSLSALPDPWGTPGQDFPMVAALLYASP
jgi:hypothetical protein